MKFTKKLSACILALMLIVCSVAFSVSAAEENPRSKDVGTDATIAIFGSDDGSVSVENKTFNLYRIFDASVSANTGTGAQPNVSYTWNIPEGQSQSPFYDFFFTSWATDSKGNPIPALLDDTGLTPASSVTMVVDKIAEYNNNAVKMSELADSLNDYAKAKGITPDASEPSSVSASMIQYVGLTYGYYLIAETTANLGGSGVRSAPILTTAAPSASIHLKATKPSIDKNIVGLNATGNYFDNTGNTRASDDGYCTPVKGKSASAGDIITFAITFKVPDRSDYRLGYTFSIKDELPEALDIVSGSLEVYESGELLDSTGSNDKKNNPNANYWIVADGSLEFNFDKLGDDGNLVYTVGNTVTVLYEAKINDQADRINTNTATLTYSSDPSDKTQTSAISSSANIYTYQLVFGKYAADTSGAATGIALTGAQFELYDEADNIIKFKKSTTENGAYIVSTAETDTVTTLEVLSQYNEGVNDKSTNIDGGKIGQFKVLGLGAGIYSLREIKAPDGYALPHNDFIFTIIDSFGSIEGVPTNLTLDFTNNDANKVKPNCPSSNAGTQKLFITVPNLPGSTLPTTGGIGTFLFIGLGVVLMGSCVVYFVIREKRKSNFAK